MIAIALLPALLAAPSFAVGVLPSGAEFTLEIAADPESRATGYMFRDHVGPREGMLFLFEEPARHSMWMKNCRVSLDLIWLDASRRIVHLAESQPPCPADGPCPIIEPMRPARYVLELAGGTARREGLRLGDAVTLLSDPPIR